MNALHAQYINLKGVKKLDYLQYLNEFDDFQACYPKAIKSTEEYRTYLSNLHDYLYNFFRRARPLYNVQELEQKTQEQFSKEWEEGKVKGWEESVNEQQGLFCQACQKAFSKQTVFDAHLTGKKHIKAQNKLNEENGQTANTVPKESKRKATAFKEFMITKLVEALGEFREETKSNVERKQALTDKERAVSSKYRILCLFISCYLTYSFPCSWNKNKSKWNCLIKILMKMKMMKRSTILSNYLSAGMVNPFLTGFTNSMGLVLNILAKFVVIMYIWEERHLISISRNGDTHMVCVVWVYQIQDSFMKLQRLKTLMHVSNLYIIRPNSTYSNLIVVYEKQKKLDISEATKADAVEEFEDAEGNVYNKKTYEDLKRQGIL